MMAASSQNIGNMPKEGREATSAFEQWRSEVEAYRFAATEAFRSFIDTNKESKDGSGGISRRQFLQLVWLGAFLAACATAPSVAIGAEVDNRPAATTPAEAMPDATVTEVPATDAPAATETATATEPLAENVNWHLDASEEEIRTVLEEELGSGPFPLDANFKAQWGVWDFSCMVESVTFLAEENYIRHGDFAVPVVGECLYLDANYDLQRITVALVIENSVERTTSLGSSVTEHVIRPEAMQEVFLAWFKDDRKIVPGAMVGFDVGLPDERNSVAILGSAHHGTWIEELYTDDQVDRFGQTGDPTVLGGFILPQGATPFGHTELTQIPQLP